jgi:glycogen debranching enzyme
MYFSRSLITGELIHKTTIASLLPLYSGAISKNRAQTIVGLLKRRSMFSTPWPVPSVPQTSSYFDPIKYWQGPTWVNTNWFLVNGLRRYAFEAEAKVLQTRTLKMVGKSGCVDYFNPLDGSAVGAPDFSWTAALTIDLLKS